MSPRPMEVRAVSWGLDSTFDTEKQLHVTGMCIDWAQMACMSGFVELVALGLERGWVRADHVCLSSDKMPLIVCAGLTMSGPVHAPVLLGVAAGTAFVERRLALVRVLVEAGADPLSASATGVTLSLSCARPPLGAHHLPVQLELDAYIVAAQRASFERRFTISAQARSGCLSTAEWRCIFRADAKSMSVKQLSAALFAGTPHAVVANDGRVNDSVALKAALVDALVDLRAQARASCIRDPATGSY